MRDLPILCVCLLGGVLGTVISFVAWGSEYGMRSSLPVLVKIHTYVESTIYIHWTWFEDFCPRLVTPMLGTKATIGKLTTAIGWYTVGI